MIERYLWHLFRAQVGDFEHNPGRQWLPRRYDGDRLTFKSHGDRIQIILHRWQICFSDMFGFFFPATAHSSKLKLRHIRHSKKPLLSGKLWQPAFGREPSIRWPCTQLPPLCRWNEVFLRQVRAWPPEPARICSFETKVFYIRWRSCGEDSAKAWEIVISIQFNATYEIEWYRQIVISAH